MGSAARIMANNCEDYDGRFYMISFKKGSRIDDKSSIFQMSVLAVNIGYDGPEGMSFQGMKNNIIETIFKFQTYKLNKLVEPKLPVMELIRQAEEKIKNKRLLANVIIDLQPTTFSKIIERIIASDYMQQ